MSINEQALENLSTEQRILVNSEVEKNKKNTVIAWLLWWFTGTLGGHRYYFGKTGSAIAMTLITVLTLGFGALITGIWALIDAFSIGSWLKENQETIEGEAIERINNSNSFNRFDSNSMTADLKDLKELLDSGAITQEEFDIKKKEILGL